jgi:hypothetical protein
MQAGAQHRQSWLVWLGVAFFVSAALALALHATCLMLECGPPRDWMPLLTPFVPISVLIVGYFIWIDQTKFKRRFEVAEKVMLVFIAARDTLEYARSDMYTGAEVEDRQKPTGESDKEARIRDRWYVVQKRLYDRRETLVALREAELLGALYLGRDAKDALAEMSSVAIAVRTSAGMLLMTATDQAFKEMVEPENRESFKQSVKRWKADCSRYMKLRDEKLRPLANPNPLNARIEEAAVKLKKVCGPYVSTADL